MGTARAFRDSNTYARWPKDARQARADFSAFVLARSLPLAGESSRHHQHPTQIFRSSPHTPLLVPPMHGKHLKHRSRSSATNSKIWDRKPTTSPPPIRGRPSLALQPNLTPPPRLLAASGLPLSPTLVLLVKTLLAFALVSLFYCMTSWFPFARSQDGRSYEPWRELCVWLGRWMSDLCVSKRVTPERICVCVWWGLCRLMSRDL